MDADQPFRFLILKELWEYKELIFMLAYRDYRAKYAQTLLGYAWALLNPLANLLLLTFIFGEIANVDTGSTPFILFTVIGLVGWSYCAEVIAGGGDALIHAQQMIKKVYFPRLVIVISKALLSLIDLAVVLLLFTGLMAYYGIRPGLQVIWLPFLLILTMVTGVTGGIWVSALTIRFRDFRYVVPFLLRVGYFVTPIAYPLSAVPERFQFWYGLNPLVGLIEGLRWSILGGAFPSGLLLYTVLTVVVLFLAGLLFFRRMEAEIADII